MTPHQNVVDPKLSPDSTVEGRHGRARLTPRPPGSPQPLPAAGDDAALGVARISVPGGCFVMPSATPYERELLWQHVEASAKRYGHASVRLDRRDWTVGVGGAMEPCSACSRPTQALWCVHGSQRVCSACARRELR